MIFSKLIESKEVLSHLPSIQIQTEKDYYYWRTGRTINGLLNQAKENLNLCDSKNYCAVIGPDGKLLGIAEIMEDKIIQPKVVFESL